MQKSKIDKQKRIKYFVYTKYNNILQLHYRIVYKNEYSFSSLIK
jgi:hypothetical protein